MTDPEAIALLARWVAELQTDLRAANQQITQLQNRVADFSYWMSTGLSPDDLQELACELDTATL